MSKASEVERALSKAMFGRWTAERNQKIAREVVLTLESLGYIIVKRDLVAPPGDALGRQKSDLQ